MSRPRCLRRARGADRPSVGLRRHDGIGSIFAAGPPLVKSATGEDVTKEELGGPHVAADAAGVVQNVVADDVEQSTWPAGTSTISPSTPGIDRRHRPGPDTGPRRLEEILELIPANPRQPYPIGPLLEAG